MDNFLHLTDERKRPNKKPNSANATVDKKRMERLKRNFLPFWAREFGRQKQEHDDKSPVK
ncbi:MAG: hypothetical protein ACE5K2_05625 [Candidatus Zixiibacteriota bacterium]